MKISKGKRQLAQLLIEAGVTQFPEGVNWAAQDKSKIVWPYGGEPKREPGSEFWSGCYLPRLAGLEVLITDWHQTKLSRDEFDQIVAETAPDADGWIEWGGGECPVEVGALIDVKYRDLHVQLGSKVGDRSAVELYVTTNWRNSGGATDIIAYRLHKPKQSKSTAVGDDETNPAAKEELEGLEDSESPDQLAKLASIYAPTLDQLLHDWRNADDYARRKQAEADEAAAMRDERWQEVQNRASDMSVTVVAREETATQSELVIDDWSDLLAGDVVWWSGDKRCQPGEYVVLEIENPGYEGWSTILLNVEGERVWVNTNDEEWRFIRRP